MLFDFLFENLLGILGAAVKTFRIVHNPIHITGIVAYIRHINNRADINTSMADKDPDSNFIAQFFFIGIALMYNAPAPLFFNKA